MTDTFDRTELDRLYAAATPGEWESRAITAWGEPTEFAHIAGPLRPRAAWGTKEWLTVDAAAIVALHNAWPAISRALERAERLERVAEAAQRMDVVVQAENREWLHNAGNNLGHCHKAPPQWDEPRRGECERCAAYMSLRAALAALEATP